MARLPTKDGVEKTQCECGRNRGDGALSYEFQKCIFDFTSSVCYRLLCLVKGCAGGTSCPIDRLDAKRVGCVFSHGILLQNRQLTAYAGQKFRLTGMYRPAGPSIRGRSWPLGSREGDLRAA
jgi:hypothetical protein